MFFRRMRPTCDFSPTHVVLSWKPVSCLSVEEVIDTVPTFCECCCHGDTGCSVWLSISRCACCPVRESLFYGNLHCGQRQSVFTVMARLLCVAVSFFISLGLDACVSGSNVLVSPSPTVIPSRPPEECTSDSVSAVTVHFNTSTLTVDEGSNIDIQLVAQGTFCKNVTVNLTFTDGTARYLSDYFYNPLITPCVTFTPGSISSSVFRIITIPNNIWEGPKSFEVGFDFPPCPNLNSGRPDTLRVNIADDDSVRVSFQSSSITVREDSGCVQLQLQSSGLYGRRFSVSFRCIEVFPVEAKDGEDFTGGVYTVEFQTLGARSSFSSTAKLPIVNDSISECTKSFICVILRPRGEDGIVIEDPTTITVVIEDDDSLEVSFEKAKYCGEEGGILSDIRLKATLFLTPFSVQIFATTLDASRPEKDCEATSGVDYTDPRFLPGGGVVQFNPAVGLLSTSLSIPLLPDNITVCTKYFGLSFVAIDNGDCLGDITPVEPTSAIATIKNSNAECSQPEIFIRFEQESYEVSEGGSVFIRLVLVNGTIVCPFNVSIAFMEGTARENEDFLLGLSTTIASFGVGETQSSNVTVHIIEDVLIEGNEDFTFRGVLDACTAARVEILPPNPRVTIIDNDLFTVGLTEDAVTVTEGTDVVKVTVWANVMSNFPFHVFINLMDGTAKGCTDFVCDRIRVDFAPFQTSVDVCISLIDDCMVEKREWFTVSLEVPPEFTNKSITAGGIVRTRVTINDDDFGNVTMETDNVTEVAVVNFVESNVTRGRGDVVKLKVKRTGSITRKLKCKVRIESWTAEKGVDFRVMTKSVVFKKLNADSEVRTVRVKLLSGNTKCFCVVLDCKPSFLVGCNKPSATVCIQGS